MVVLTFRSGRAAARPAGRRRRPRARGERSRRRPAARWLGVGRRAPRPPQPGLGELIGRSLGGLATGGLLQLRPHGGGRVLAVPLTLDAGPRARPRARAAPFSSAASGWPRGSPGGLLPLGVGDRLVGDGGLAVAGLGLLELSLLHQVVLAAHGAGHFLGLARDAVEQPLAGLGCFVVGHVVPVPTLRPKTRTIDSDVRRTSCPVQAICRG